jgi:hypothetical protein
MKHLPYRVTTSTGAIIDMQFPLHAQTVSAVTVSQLLDSVLQTLSREVALAPTIGNGDILQALAMALAVRSGIIHAPFDFVAAETQALLATALDAVSRGEPSGLAAGHA